MNRCPFLTIGIASYNYSAYLQKAFDAIKIQSFKDFEVIYADDGSTDNSVEIIKKIIKENCDITIRLVQGENIGVMGNKQRILDSANGTYIMLCDADDWMEPNCLEILATEAEKANADRVVSEIINVAPNGKVLHIQKISKNATKWTEVLHHGALYRRSILSDNLINFEDRIPDDFCFVEKFNVYVKKVSFVRKAVYNWCIHDDSTSNAKNTVWAGVLLLKGVLDQTNEIIPRLDDNKDILLLQAEAIKYYYYNLLKGLRGLEKSQIGDFYNKMNLLIREYNADYLKNPYYKFFSKSPFRKKVHIFMSCFAYAEKFNLGMGVMYTLFLLSKIITFDL